jgi:predicted nucleic acid-binding protein
VVTALDTSVILDVAIGDPVFGMRSRSALTEAAALGMVIICDVVLAETAAAFADDEEVRRLLDLLQIRYVPTTSEVAVAAGLEWGRYRARGGTRERIASDFIVAAHAAAEADQLLTRDSGFANLTVEGLRVIHPSDATPS